VLCNVLIAEQLEKLLRADNASRAVKLCSAVDAGSPVRQLALFMLGLELRSTSVAADGPSYRAAPELERFENVVRETVGREAARLAAGVRPFAVAALGTGAVALIASGAAALFGAQGLRVASMVVGAASALGTYLALRWSLNLRAGVRVIRDRVLPLLVPVDEMSDDRRQAAAAARDRLAEPVVARSGLPVFVAGAVALAGAGGALFFVTNGGGDGGSPGAATHLVEARVTATTGRAPVAPGARCTLAIAPDPGELNCHIAVRCGGTGLYGTESGLGYARCEWNGAVATSALDLRYDDRDPALRYDRRSHFVEVHDATWSVTLEVSGTPTKTP